MDNISADSLTHAVQQGLSIFFVYAATAMALSLSFKMEDPVPESDSFWRLKGGTR